MKSKTKSILLAVIFCLAFGATDAQSNKNSIKAEPPFWWTGMKSSQLQLMIYSENIQQAGSVVIEYPGVELKKTYKVENPNYLFIDLELSANAKPGSFPIKFVNDGKTIIKYNYELRPRKPGSAMREGFGPSDIIYLLMPDRFANADPANDNVKGMREKADRSNPDGRHGGDLQGIINHLNYLDSLGATALWLNPVLENNMPSYSYHGYAITDFYKVDPRFGTNEDYIELIEKCHQQDIKMIMDMVFNHCGLEHWWMNNLPMKNWIHQFPEFTQTNFRTSTIMDPHASDYDKNKTTDGWFVRTMPDLNQKNEFVTNYLIQNSIWWIEYADLDGIRMDTYPYADKEFMARWMADLKREYPNFDVVGESWIEPVAMVAYWQDNSNIKDDYDSNLETLFDFPLYFSLGRAFTEENGWSTGIARLYETLGLDFLYADPNQLVTFADNHDTDRFFSKIEEDVDDFKLAMAFLMTTRGIPLIYYGTEIGMTGFEHEGHGFIREDFPGGWAEDERSAFIQSGRTDAENELFSYLQNIMNWRKRNSIVQTGKLTHYIPRDGTYVYFRHNDEGAVMTVLNNSTSADTLESKRYSEFLKDFTSGFDIIGKQQIENLDQMIVPAKKAMIIELKP